MTDGDYVYSVMWGWKNDCRTMVVGADSHYEGSRGLKLRRDGETVANFDRDAYRTFVRADSREDLPETFRENGADQ